MARLFKNRKKDRSGSQFDLDRNTEKPWEKISGGFRGAQRYSRSWNSGYNGPGKGTN